MKATLIINEQHKLLSEQTEILEEMFGTWNTFLVPASGWNKEEREEIMESLSGTVIFASPIPSMIKSLSYAAGMNDCAIGCAKEYPYAPRSPLCVNAVLVFTNDHREKKELPDGKIISVTASKGWYLE